MIVGFILSRHNKQVASKIKTFFEPRSKGPTHGLKFYAIIHALKSCFHYLGSPIHGLKGHLWIACLLGVHDAQLLVRTESSKVHQKLSQRLVHRFKNNAAGLGEDCRKQKEKMNRLSKYYKKLQS